MYLNVFSYKMFRASAAAVAWLMPGYVILFLFRATAPVFIGSLFMMSGYLSGMAVFGARIRDLTPPGKAGMLRGVRIFSRVLIPGVAGPYIGRAALQNAEMILNSDGTYSFVPNANIFLRPWFRRPSCWPPGRCGREGAPGSRIVPDPASAMPSGPRISS